MMLMILLKREILHFTVSIYSFRKKNIRTEFFAKVQLYKIQSFTDLQVHTVKPIIDIKSIHIHHVYYTKLNFQVNTQQQTERYLQICEEEMVAISVFDLHAKLFPLCILPRFTPLLISYPNILKSKA